MLDKNFVKKDEQWEDVGWRTELVHRVSKWIFIIYHDGIARGSIELYEQKEIDKWQKITQELNELP